MVVSSKESGFV
jgi:hypothetical protein